MNYRSYNRGFKITVTIMFCLLSMVVLYCVRLCPNWAALPLMAAAGLFLSGVSAEEDFVLSLLSFIAVVVFALGFVGGYTYLAPYVVLFGLYPLLKPFFDTRGDGFLRWMLKMIYFSVAALLITQASAGTVLLPYLNRIPMIFVIVVCYMLFILYYYLLWLFAYFYVQVIRRRL